MHGIIAYAGERSALLGHALDASSALDLVACGCVVMLMALTWIYRVLTRRFDWGPSDT